MVPFVFSWFYRLCCRRGEVEDAGGGLHLLRHLADEVLALGLRQALAAGGLGLHLGRDLDDVSNVFDDGFRRDTVFFVVAFLDVPAAERFGDSPFHGGRDAVRVHDDFTVGVTRRAADGLDERSLRTEEAFLVGIEDGDEGHFRDVEAFAQEVDADEDVELPEA